MYNIGIFWTNFCSEHVSQSKYGLLQETTWRSGKKGRRRYSESEEYDSDSDSRTESSNQLEQDKFNPLRYRAQFNL
jgi:hypothetical protein